MAFDSTPRRTYHFFIDSGDGYAEYLFRFSEGVGTTNRVTVRNGQKPDVPQPPAVSEGKAFAGWYAKKKDSTEFEDAPDDFDTPVTEDEVVYLYAVYEDFWTVTFHDQYSDQTGDFPVAFIRRGIRNDEGKALVKISDLTTTYNGGREMAFFGWSATKITVPGSAEDDEGDPVKPLACDEDGCIVISGDTELYPIYKSVKWLSFWSGPTGSGATYFPARYYFGGVGPDKLEVPERSGFTFEGWYAGALDSETEEVEYSDVQIANASGILQNNVIDGGMSVYENKLHLIYDAVLYAKWTVTATAEYTVNTYKVTGEEETLVRTYTEKGPVGSAIPLDKYKHESIEGYLYHHPAGSLYVEAADGVLNVFYAPYDHQDSSTLTFRDSTKADSESPQEFNVAAGAPLSAYAPETPVREDYNFTGWFRDRSCTIPVDLSALKMPDHDLTLYAGWEVKEYLVQIDPNYGALYAYNDSHVLEGTGATWFWEGPGGQPIQEYQHVTRDCVESNSGSWYYVNHSKAYYGDGPTGDRKTYYTQDPDEATEYTRFEYGPGVYRYAGWYEVHEDGSETLYDFSRVVDHDTTLRLHWKNVGNYYLKFVSGSGTLNESGDTEFLDKDVSYADNAQVVITRSAIAPEGYIFAGWRVEGDDSGRLYGLGESFTLHAGWAVSTSGRETVTLEAVYIKVGTASIVYDANGGAFTDGFSDYGSPGDNTVYGPGPELTWNEETHTVSGIVNNSNFVLSSGAGLTRAGARLKGWSDKPVCDDSAGFYGLGETVGVDTEKPITLYAVREVPVTYHLNKTDEPTAAWGDGLWDASYTYDSTADTCAKWVNVGTVTAEPAGIPVCTGEQMFFYWTADTTARTAYDFTQPVTGALDLYALWRGPIEVPVHAADASALAITQRNNGQVGWAMHNVMAGTEEVSLLSPGTYVTNVPGGYTFAFVAAHDKNTGLQTITEDEAVTAIYYNQSAKHLYVKYASGADAQLGEDMELYFVYYWQHRLNIRYKKMLSSGEMVDAAMSGNQPADTAAALGSYDMADGVTTPLAWAADDTDALTHYAFAVGSDGATNASALNLITRVSDSDGDRPALLLRSTWRGFRYSTDDGASWVSCGYEPTLYVVYYTQQPTVIMFRERTVGDSADMGTPFTFNLKVTEETRTTTTVIRQAKVGDDWTDVDTNVTVDTTPATLLYDTGADGNSPFLLKDGQANSAILFYSKQENGPAYTADPDHPEDGALRRKTTVTVETAQTAELVQTTIDAFDTTVTENGAAYDAGAPRYTFTASEDSEGVRDVTFTNTNRAKTVQVHVGFNTKLQNNRNTPDDAVENSGRGGAVYATGSVTVSGNVIYLQNNTARYGGVLYYAGTGVVNVESGAFSGNSAEDGGVLYATGGAITFSGDNTLVQNNTATGIGGAVYSQSGAVTVGGGVVYSQNGAVTVSGGAVTGNNAQNGGAVSAETGNVTVSGGAMTNNRASVNGGAVYLGSGTLEMSGDTMGDATVTDKANEAVNGAAVFIQTGRGTFSGGTIAHNTATGGGAVGMGGPVAPATETTVRMDFSGTIRIQDNTCGAETRNVYLDQDTDAVINTGGFGDGAYVGIYAPDGVFFTNRGAMGDKFGVCSGSATTLPAFHNDRQANLKAAVDDITKRIYWSSPIKVKVRYLASYSPDLPNGTTGIDTKKYSSNSYYPAFDDAAISVLADALRGKNEELSSTAVYGTAILNAKVSNTEYRTYDKYLTRLKWEDGVWKVQARDGSLVPLGSNQLVVYYTEPAYLSIENNTEMDMNITSLDVTLSGESKSVLNSSTVPGVTGFGLVFSRNGTIQEELLPVEMTDGVYRLEKNGGSVNILIPGCRDCQFTMEAYFVGGTGTVKQRINGEEWHPNVSSVTVTGKLNKNSTNFEIIYGEDKPICKIVCKEPTGISAGDYLKKSVNPIVDGKYEYTFAKMRDAVAFAVKCNLTDVDIQMLVDYLMPNTDTAVISTDSEDNYFQTISLTTARSGEFQYPGTDADRRATISRGVGNAEPLIDVTGNVGTSGTAAEETYLRVHDINFDGKNLAGACEGGALSTVNCRVEITDAKLVNCVSRNGGALFISYGTANNASKGARKNTALPTVTTLPMLRPR